MLVKLTYFKPETGKYYTSDEYESRHSQPWQIFDEVRTFRARGILPGLQEGAINFDILVDIPDLYPALIKRDKP